MLYILYGPDDFSLREELATIKAGLGEGEALATNTTTFDARQLRLGQLADACMAMPFLGSHRLVIVEGFSHSSIQPPDLAQMVAAMPPTTALVLTDGEVKKGNAFLKALAPMAQAREFPLIKGASLERWVGTRVEREGGTMASGAVKMLAAAVGDNLWLLSSEIEKLLLYTAGRRIEEQDVEEVVSYAREANVFPMVDAIVEGRAQVAAPLLHRLLQEGDTAPYLLYMLTRQLRLLVQAKELSARGVPPRDIKARLGVTSDFVLNKALEQGRRYSAERLEHIYRRLLETDLSIKRGILKGELALDLLVAELCR